MRCFKTLWYYLDVTFVNIKMAFLTILEYPTAVLGWLLSNPVQFVVGFATIRFVVEEFGHINGWDYGQLAFLYGLSVISHALSMIFFVQGWFMGFVILEGDLDRLLTRPLSVVYQLFFTNVNIFGVTDLGPGIIVFAYGCIKTGFVLTPMNLLLILAMLVGATFIRGGIYLIVGSTSFWTRSVADIGAFSQEIFDKTTMYPLSMYPEGLQFILTYMIPIGWVSYYPVSGLLQMEGVGSGSNSYVWITLLVGILVMTVAACVFRLGLKKYESAGN